MYDPLAHGAHCHVCPLKGNAVVPPLPPTKALRLIVVGEGPGRNEEKLGAPFVGASGQFLDEHLRRDAGVSRSECHLTNAALCRGESDADNERAAECCAPRLLKELASIDAGAPILTLGKSATKTVLGRSNIMVARGFRWDLEEVPAARIAAARKTPLKAETLRLRGDLAGRTVFPALHPAFILRADTWKPVFQIDMRRIRKFLAGNPCEEHVAPHRIGGPELLYEVLRDADVVSCDIETDGIDVMTTNILSIGVSDGIRTVELWPWVDAWGPLFAGYMRTRLSVVFHNGANFDTIVLERHGAGW